MLRFDDIQLLRADDMHDHIVMIYTHPRDSEDNISTLYEGAFFILVLTKDVVR